VTKLKNSNCVKSSNCDETQIGMKLKNWKSEKKLKYEEKTQTQNVTKLKLWQNLKTKIMTTQYLDFEKTQNQKLWQNLKYDEFQFMKKKTLK
jgi:hypothetical protein